MKNIKLKDLLNENKKVQIDESLKSVWQKLVYDLTTSKQDKKSDKRVAKITKQIEKVKTIVKKSKSLSSMSAKLDKNEFIYGAYKNFYDDSKKIIPPTMEKFAKDNSRLVQNLKWLYWTGVLEQDFFEIMHNDFGGDFDKLKSHILNLIGDTLKF